MKTKWSAHKFHFRTSTHSRSILWFASPHLDCGNGTGSIVPCRSKLMMTINMPQGVNERNVVLSALEVLCPSAPNVPRSPTSSL
ncbi:hypothetical protein A4X13_0g8506, partial [Tilletia indica]